MGGKKKSKLQSEFKLKVGTQLYTSCIHVLIPARLHVVVLATTPILLLQSKW